jgi:hypothetical protein
LEISVVPVPANPAALIQRGIETSHLRKWAEGVMKRGRVLSGANEAHTREALAHCQDAAEHLQGVLASLDGDGYTNDLVIDGEHPDASRIAERAAEAVRKHLSSKWGGRGNSEIDIAAIPAAGDTRGRSPRRRSALVWGDAYGRSHGSEETHVTPHEARALVDEAFRESFTELLQEEIARGIARQRGRVD